MPNEQGRGPWIPDRHAEKVIFQLPNNVVIIVRSDVHYDASLGAIARTAQLMEHIPEILDAARNLGGDIHPMHHPDAPCIYCDAVAKVLRKVDR